MGLLIAIHVILCLSLIGIILLQPGKSDMGVGFGSSSQSIFGSKGAGNFLTKATSFSAVFFLITSFALTRIRVKETNQSVTETVSEKDLPAVPTPAAGETPPAANGPVDEHAGHDHAPGEGHR